MTVKLKDVAEHLDISVSTVSRVVNNKAYVHPDTRKKVLKALKELGYRPNDIARSLKNRTTNAIGAIVPDITNSFFSNILKGIEKVFKHDFSVILCNSDENEKKEEKYLDLLLKKQISALIIASVCNDVEFIKEFKHLGIPVVFIDNIPDIDDNFDYVSIDNEKASYNLVNHLLDLGHQKIWTITGPLKETTAYERLKGWQKAMKERGIHTKKEWIGEGDFKQQSGYRIMNEFLQNKDDIPTAIFAANNGMAYGAIKAIQEKGLKIPEDIAIVCFDAVDPAGLMRPQITSVIQPAEQIGEMAAEIVVRKIKKPDLNLYEKVILEPELVIRESSDYKRK